MGTKNSTQIVITGQDARDIDHLVRSVTSSDRKRTRPWIQVRTVGWCGHGCYLYARQRGCVIRYAVFHSATYGCVRGRGPDAIESVSVRPSAA